MIELDFTMTWLTAELALFVLGAGVVNFVAAMSPGPDTLLIIRLATRHGLRCAILGSIGIGLGISIHMAVVLSGLTYVMATMPMVMVGIGLLGGAYLAYLGVLVLRDTTPFDVNTDTAEQTGMDSKPLLLGFFTNVLNPKAFVFFLGVIAPMVQAHDVLTSQIPAMVFMTIVLCAMVTVWFIMLSYGATRPWFTGVVSHYGIWVNRATGAIFLIYAGIMIYSAIII